MREGFEKWAERSGFSRYDWPNMYQAWQARQPEIDSLKEQQRLFEADNAALLAEARELQDEVERLRKEKDAAIKLWKGSK